LAKSKGEFIKVIDFFTHRHLLQ